MTAISKNYRAARVWAGLTREEVAAHLEIDVSTVKRRETGGGDPKRGELVALAGLCDVPLAFLLGGFEALGAEPSRSETNRRLDNLEGAVRVLVGVAADIPLTDLQDQLTDNVTRELLGLDAVESGQAGRSKDDEAGAS